MFDRVALSLKKNAGTLRVPALSASSLTRFFLYILVFSQPFKHAATVKGASFYLMLLFFIAGRGWAGLAKSIRARYLFPVSAFAAVIGAALLSIALSPYFMESLNALRKNLFVQAGIFFVILSEFRSLSELKPLITAAAAGFIALSAVVVLEGGLIGLYSLSTLTHDGSTMWGGYPLSAAYYIPLTAGCLFLEGVSFRLKAALIISLLAEAALLILYGNRTVTAALIFSFALVTVISKRYRFILQATALFIAVVACVYFFKPALLKPYTLPLSYNIFGYPSMVERYGVWSGMADIISSRPATGYGYGWKKLSLVAGDGFLERWRDEKSPAYDYFSRTGYGSANPHNLALQILFETGIVGLASFTAFWASVYSRAFRAFFSSSGPVSGFFSYGILTALLTYIIINITNGLWEETSGNLMSALAAIVLVAGSGGIKGRGALP